MLQDFFDGKDLCKTINPDEAVAYGAAVLAAKMSDKGNQMIRDLMLLDVTPLSLGIDSHGEVMSVLIPRNTPIPVTKKKMYETNYDYQSRFHIEVYQGERSRSKDNIQLGEFFLNNIPLAPKGVTKVNVRFDIDADGILKVSAEEPTTGKKKKITITNSNGRLTKEDIEKILEVAERCNVDDKEYKKKVDVYNALEDYIYVIKRKMENDNIRSSLSLDVLNNMDDVVEEAMQWLELNKLAEYNVMVQKKKELEFVWNSLIGQFV